MTPEAKVKLEWMIGVSRPIRSGDLPDRYLKSRGLHMKQFPNDLRQDHNGNMVALIRGPEGNVVSYQRTFLQDWPNSKERRFAAGVTIPPGSAIRLYPHGKTMGVAEGIETAIAAAKIHQLPVWSVMSTEHMKAWRPPEGVQRVKIFADLDRSMAGEKAAETLMNELGARDIQCTINLPPLNERTFGDWHDFLTERERDEPCLSR